MCVGVCVCLKTLIPTVWGQFPLDQKCYRTCYVRTSLRVSSQEITAKDNL